jgi:asparagine synthase (glutamine-hydrolysing)
MMTKDGRYVIVFNGEIYNFKELRKDLEASGVSFSTNSDTEVVLKLFVKYKEKCLEYLNGMFGFAIFDTEEKRLFVARDRLGIKPIYYCSIDGNFVFSSEIKSILKYPKSKRNIYKNSLYEFLFRQYVSAPHTIFEGIYKLEPGYYMVVDSGGIRKEKYWDLDYFVSYDNEESAIVELRRLLEASVKRRLVSDVPLGAFLSGGVDSSIIVSLMNKLKGEGVKTFSIGFEDSEFDESKYAKLVSEKYETDHEDVVLDSSYMDLLDKVIYHLDEPLSDFASLPTYFLSHLARRKVKVVLTGEGGDENFGGYDYYRQFKLANNILSRKFLFNKKVFAYSRFNEFLNSNVFSGSEHFLRNKLVSGRFNSKNFVNEMLAWDTKVWLPDDLLMKVDKMTMANSLEARVPFLDHKFVEFCASLNPKFKLNGRDSKYILKKAFVNELPREVLNRKKHGFDVPVEKWFNTMYKNKVDGVIDSNKDVLRQFFDQGAINKMLNGKRDNLFLWRLYNFLVWNKKFN